MSVLAVVGMRPNNANYLSSEGGKIGLKTLLYGWHDRISRIGVPFMCTRNGYDVFLGGSCGETTWRQDIIIPYLKRVGITYYNPQRDSWTPEMIKTEELAKESSKVLLFVIDCHQANVVSFIEIAFLAAREAPLVVVLPTDDEIETGFCGGNREDRLRSVKFLRSVLNRHRIPQCRNINEALNLIETVIVSQKSFWDAINDVRCRYVYTRIMTKRGLCKFSTAAKNMAAYLSPRQLVLPFKDPKVWRVFRPRCRTDWFKLNLLIIEILLFFTLCVCCPAIPFIFILGGVIIGHIIFLMLLPVRLFQGRDRPRSPKRKSTPANYDVYLGGSGSRLDWITQTALPVLTKNSLSYMDASYCAFDQRLTMVPFCRFVMYVVSCTDTFLSGLVELAYLVGNTRHKVVGCIAANIPRSECQAQDLEDCGLTEKMAENYRRGLLYLRDMANHSRVQIFDNLTPALVLVVDRIRNSENANCDDLDADLRTVHI